MTKRFTGNRKGLDKSGTLAPGANVMEEFRIDFLSPVDRPAQAGAVATILKRDDEATPQKLLLVAKNGTPGVVTSAEEGHTHIVWLHGPVGETTLQMAEGADHMHDHPFTIGADGILVVHENDGHEHTVDATALMAAIVAIQKSDGDHSWLDIESINKEHTMPEPKKTEKNDDLQATVTDLQARLEQQGIIAGMNDAEKAHFATLEDDEAKKAFVSKSASDRHEEIAEIKKAADASDPVVYTSTDGDVFRKSDDARMVRAAQKADKAEKRALKAETLAADASYSKRADEELAALPGTLEERTAIVKALDSIDDPAVRKQAFESMKAANTAMSKSFTTEGTTHGGENDADSPTSKLDALAKAYASEHKVTEATAFTKVLETDEGKSLYAEMDQQ
ncbi:MAG: hypothetical protein WBG86_14435 [Polyangiales bacterium]